MRFVKPNWSSTLNWSSSSSSDYSQLTAKFRMETATMFMIFYFLHNIMMASIYFYLFFYMHNTSMSMIFLMLVNMFVMLIMFRYFMSFNNFIFIISIFNFTIFKIDFFLIFALVLIRSIVQILKDWLLKCTFCRLLIFFLFISRVWIFYIQ